jgi:hypothetical protein
MEDFQQPGYVVDDDDSDCSEGFEIGIANAKP